jgi:hypothetical protein
MSRSHGGREGSRVASDETVTLVWGPLDGAVRLWPPGVTSELIRISIPDRPAQYHRYVRADVLGSEEASVSANGARRFLYVGQEVDVP